jgi:sugar diacid utilization regulator
VLCDAPAGSYDLAADVVGDHILVEVALAAGVVVASVARATASAEEVVSRRLGALQRSLSLALADPAPVPALLARLKRVCNATAALIDPRGEIVHTTGPVPRLLLFGDISTTQADTQTLSVDGWHGFASRITDPSLPDSHGGWLVVTSRRAGFPDANALSAVHVAASLIEASQRMGLLARQQERAIRVAVLEQALALRRERHDAELAARVASLGITFDAEVRVVVATFVRPPRADQRLPAADALVDALGKLLSAAGIPVLLTTRPNGATMLVQSTAGALRRLLADRQDQLPALQIGIGRPVTVVDGVVDSHHDAQLAVQTLRRGPRDQQVMSYEDFDFAMRLFADVGLDRMVTWAEDFLRPLADRENLLAGLRSYFENDQNINVAADALKIHHNSLRYRLGKVEELLTINLKQPAAVSSVFLALTAVDLTRRPGALKPRSPRSQDRNPGGVVDTPAGATGFSGGEPGGLGVVHGGEH